MDIRALTRFDSMHYFNIYGTALALLFPCKKLDSLLNSKIYSKKCRIKPILAISPI